MIPDKIIHVCCAIIENNGQVLAAQRHHKASNGGKWEFPGGKIEPGETVQECIKREIKEELLIEITLADTLPVVVHQYPDKTIILHPFTCTGNAQKAKPTEHKRIAWIDPDDLHTLDWSDADIKVWQYYKNQYLPEKKRGGIE